MKTHGKVAVIRGASEGLDKGTAKVFLEDGWKVVIAARTKEKLEKAKEELTDMGEMLAVPTDAADSPLYRAGLSFGYFRRP